MTYKTELYTPGDHTPGKTIVRFNQAIQDDYNDLLTRRRELESRLRAVDQEVAAILAGLGELVANDRDWRQSSNRLADLRAEAEALKAGIDYLSGQAGLLERSNVWLKRG